MKRQTSSKTMLGPALMRGAHALLDGEPRILDDSVALQLLPLEYDGVSFSSRDEITGRRDYLNTARAKLYRAIMVFRSRYTEDCLQEAMASGVRQYVLLGAGLDTFAYRQPPWARSVTIFEVDHPASQAFKRQRFEQRRIGIPDNVRFCPCDFEQTSLDEALASASFDRRAKTFFSWLGVTQYLTREAIEVTLRFVASCPPQSEMVFAFILPHNLIAQSDIETANYFSSRVVEMGEPLLTRLDIGEWRQWLAGLGYSTVFHLTVEDTQKRYFNDRRDGLRAPQYEQMIRATV